jgi:hypothetical protein
VGQHHLVDMGRFWSDDLWTEMKALMVQFSQVSGEFAEFFFGCIGHFNPFPGIVDLQAIVKNCDEMPTQAEKSADLKYYEMLSSGR